MLLSPTKATFAALAAVAASVALAACSADDAAAPPGPKVYPAVTDEAGVSPDEGDGGAAGDDATAVSDAATSSASMTPGIVPSRLIADLKEAGIDTDHLPDLDDVKKSRPQLHAVMESFTKSIGGECSSCHLEKANDAGIDFGASTPQKNVAKGMWKNFVGDLAFKDGTPLYCDSCHQGKQTFLDRSDDDALGAWMRQNFVAKLTPKDGTAETCASCHGTPFDPSFLDGWEKTAP